MLTANAVTMYLSYQLKNARDKFWQGYKHLFIMFIVCMTCSYVIKISLNLVGTTFTPSIESSLYRSNQYVISVLGTFLYALAELGFIFQWVMVKRPDDLF